MIPKQNTAIKALSLSKYLSKNRHNRSSGSNGRSYLVSTLFLFSFCLFIVDIEAATLYSRANGNWNATTTWSSFSGGGPGSSVPVAGDAVIIERGFSVTLTANAACASVAFTTAATTNTSIILNGFQLAVSGTITIPNTSASGINSIAVGGGILTAANIAFTNGGSAKRQEITISTGTVTVSGDITTSSTGISATITFTGGGFLNVAGSLMSSGTVGGTLTTVAGCTVNYNGGSQTVRAVNYSGTLMLSGSGTKSLGTLASISGNLTLSGTTTVSRGIAFSIGGNLTVGTGSIFATSGTKTTTPLTVTGTTNITGTLTLANKSTKTFTGNVTLNTGAVWNESGLAAVNFGGDLVNNATTFTANTGVHTFSGASKVISGSVAIANTTITGTYTNNGILTVSTALSGSGTLTQGSSSILNIGSGSTITGLNASANVNTVNYISTLGQTVKAVNYSSLGVNGSATNATTTKTLAGTITVSGVLTIGTNTTLTLGSTAITLTLSGTGANTLVNNGIILMNGSGATAHLLQIAASSIATLGTLTTGTGSTVEYNGAAQTVFVRTYNHLILSGSGIKTMGATTVSKNLTVSGTATATSGAALTLVNLTVGTGSTFATGATSTWTLSVTGTTNITGTLTLANTAAKTFTGNVTINAGGVWNETAIAAISFANGLTSNGTFTANTSIHTFQTNNQIFAGTASIPNITVTTITLTNNGTLTCGTALSGTGTITQGVSSNLSVGGSFGITGAVATANGNKITYSGVSAQNIRTIIYQNLEANNAAGLTLLANTTVQANVTMTSGKINLLNFNLAVSGSVFNASTTSYIVTNGTGRLQIFVGNSPITFPVGNSTYNPLIITNTGTTDLFGVKVIDGVSGVNNSNLLVNRFWDIAENVVGESNLTLTAQWATVNQNGSYATGSTVKFGYNNGTVWTEVLSSQSGSDPAIKASGSFNVSGDDLTGGHKFGIGKDAGFLPATSNITVGSLTDFGNQCVGSNSAEQTYSVSGGNLSADIVITAPSGYQVSTSGSGVGFGSSVTLAATSGFVSSTPVYVRFAPGSAGTFNGNISHTSGATTRNVAVTGVGGAFGPSVSSPTSSSVGAIEVNLGGNITNIGCSNATVRGIEYSTTNGFLNGAGTKVFESGSFGPGIFTVNVTGLTNSTVYYYKAYATNTQGTSYSVQGTFTTLAGARYAVATGNWSSTATWSATSGGVSGASVPTTGQAVFIEGNKTVTIDFSTAANLNSLNIDAGCAVTVSTSSTLSVITINVDGTLNLSSSATVTSTTVNINNGGVLNRTVNQTFAPATINVNSGGTYIHASNGGSIPTANWNANSLLKVTGITSTPLTGGLDQSFGNVEWGCVSQSVDQNLPITGTNMLIAGNLKVTAGLLVLNQPFLSVIDYTQTGGTFNLCNGADITRTLNVAGNFAHSSPGILKMIGGNTGSIGSIDFIGTSAQTFTSGGTLLETKGKIQFNITTNSIVDFGTNNIISSGASGVFTNNGTLITKNTAGISASGTSGTVQSAGTRSYSNGSYIYNGSTAQAAGNGLTQCANLTIDNAAGVTLSTALTINNGGLLSIGTVTANTVFNDGGNQLLREGASGTIDLTMANGSTVNISAANTGTALQNIATSNLATGTTIAYISGSAQAVCTELSYQQLLFSGAGIKTVSGPLTVAQNWSTTGGLASLGSSVVNVNGNIAGTGPIQLGDGSITIEGNWTNTGTLTPGTSTVIFDGLGAQAMGAGPYFNLTLAGSGTKTGTMTTLGGDLVLTGTDTITTGAALSISGDLNIGDGAAFTAAAFPLTVTGATIIGAGTSGILTIGSITGAKSFNDDLSINSGATFNNSANTPVTIAGNISNSGILSAGTGAYTLSGAANDIIGTVTIPTVSITGAYTNDGTFTVGTALSGSGSLTQGAGTVLNIGGAISITGLDAGTNENTVNFTNTAGGQSIPAYSFSNLTFGNTSGFNTMTGNVSIEEVLTLSGGKLALGSNTLTINGDISGMTNTSCFTANGSSNIIVGSGVLSNSLFLDQSVRGTSNKLNNLIYSRNITLGDTVEIKGMVTPTAGTLTTNNKLKLISDANGDAGILTGSGTYISGSVTVQRYIPSAGRRWRFLASPSVGATLADWKSDIYITGAGGTTNGFDSTLSNQAGVYNYNEAATGNLNQGWLAATNITNALTAGKGYRVFVRGDRTPGRLNGSIATQNAVTLKIVKPVTTGDVNMQPTFTSTGVPANDGWNLMGNPYPCAINWDAFHDAGRSGTTPYIGTDYARLDAVIYVLDPGGASTGYTSYNAFSGARAGDLAGGIIPSGAAFWVKATGAAPSMTMKEIYKTSTAAGPVFKSSPNVQFSIKVMSDDLVGDETVIKYVQEATEGMDGYDIAKMYGADINIASMGNDGSFLAANYKPFNGKSDTIQLSLGFSTSGRYQLRFSDVVDLLISEKYTVSLIDVAERTITDLRAASTYTFAVDINKPETFGNGRFKLVVGESTTTAVYDFDATTEAQKLYVFPSKTADWATVYSNKSMGTTNVTITDITGKTVATINNPALDENKLALDFSGFQTGLYFISITDQNQTVQTLKCVKE